LLARVRVLTTSRGMILQHPAVSFIASLSNITHESEKGYLKFVEEGYKEIEILQHLKG
jgi:hypothetical protein